MKLKDFMKVFFVGGARAEVLASLLVLGCARADLCAFVRARSEDRMHQKLDFG